MPIKVQNTIANTTAFNETGKVIQEGLAATNNVSIPTILIPISHDNGIGVETVAANRKLSFIPFFLNPKSERLNFLRFNFSARKADKKLPARITIATMSKHTIVLRHDVTKKADP
ncbi:hypothetical protein [Thermococcus sp.]